jgi:hypothetical protein
MRSLDPERALIAYRERGTLREAARALGCSEVSVWRALVAIGAPRARTGPRRAPELEQRLSRAINVWRVYAEAGRPLTFAMLARWAQVEEALLRATYRNRVLLPRKRERAARRAHG